MKRFAGYSSNGSGTPTGIPRSTSNYYIYYYFVYCYIVYKFLKRDKDGIKRKKRGGKEPTLEPMLNIALRNMINTFRDQGAAVHVATVQACTRALICHHQKLHLLQQFKVSDSWARKWLTKNQFSYRTVTKGKLKKTNIDEVIIISNLLFLI